MDRDYFLAFVQYEYFIRAVIYQDNQLCVKNVINHDYWIANKRTIPDPVHEKLYKIYIGLLVSIILMVVLGVFLSIRWIHRRSKEKAEENASTNQLNENIE